MLLAAPGTATHWALFALATLSAANWSAGENGDGTATPDAQIKFVVTVALEV